MMKLVSLEHFQAALVAFSVRLAQDGTNHQCVSVAPTLAGSSAYIGDEAPAAGVRLGRAHLTWVTPGPSDGGTTHGLGADDATKLALAHLVIHLAEAGTGAIV